jgi:hypothetical protein
VANAGTSDSGDIQEAQLTFSTDHYINRVGPENLESVEGAAGDIAGSPDFYPGGSCCFTEGGINYEMRSFLLPDGTLNIGTIFPIK